MRLGNLSLCSSPRERVTYSSELSLISNSVKKLKKSDTRHNSSLDLFFFKQLNQLGMKL